MLNSMAHKGMQKATYNDDHSPQWLWNILVYTYINLRINSLGFCKFILHTLFIPVTTYMLYAIYAYILWHSLYDYYNVKFYFSLR